jgi:hypothetical protein
MASSALPYAAPAQSGGTARLQSGAGGFANPAANLAPPPPGFQPSYGGGDDVPMGIPQGRPPWMIPVIVGVVALFLGGGLAIVIALAR